MSTAVYPLPRVESHSLTLAYVAWIFGFVGAHRFYLGSRWLGLLWLLTFGLFGIGWLVDLFLMPSLYREACAKYPTGRYDYSASWLLFAFLGWAGIHRFYMGKVVTGILFLVSGGLFGFGLIWDLFTLNEQVSELNNASVMG
ncbi:MAG: TM2 domain-containing protein [Planctomycetaceae bacterium]